MFDDVERVDQQPVDVNHACPIGGVLDFEQLSTDDWTYLKLYQLHAHTVLRNMQLICSQHVHELRSCTPE